MSSLKRMHDDMNGSSKATPAQSEGTLRYQKAAKKNAKICYPHLSPRGNREFFQAKNLMIKLKPEHASMFEIEADV